MKNRRPTKSYDHARLEARVEVIEGILVNHGLADFLAGEIYDIEDVPQMIKPANRQTHG